jgi:hypothetical protein
VPGSVGAETALPLNGDRGAKRASNNGGLELNPG